MVELRTLGRVDLRDADGREIRAILAQPKRLALLTYLALSSRDGFRSRDTVLALFWPDLDDSHARGALSQACRFLRRNLDADAVIRRGNDNLALDLTRLHCDAVAFEDAFHRGDFEAAAALYGGEFLDGVFVTGSAPELESWIETERARLRRIATVVERQLAHRCVATGAIEDAARHSRAAASLSPDDESAQRQLISVLAHAGERAEALKVYDDFAHRLASEYQAEPSMETRAVVDAARHDEERFARNNGVWLAPSSAGIPPRYIAAARSRVIAKISAVAIAAVVLGGAWSARHFSTRAQLDPNLVAVAPFDVLGGKGHEEFREGLVDLVSASLDGAGPLRAVPVSRVVKIWNGRADAAAAARLGSATTARLVIYGRVVSTGGDSVRVTAVLFDAQSGGAREFEVNDEARRLDRIGDSITVAVLKDLGRTRPIGAVRSAALGSTSLAAMKAFLRGEQFFRRSLADSATAYYARATEIDPRFALAWRRLGEVRSWNLWDADSLIVLYRNRAASLNFGLPARESLLVVAESLYQALFQQGKNAHWGEHHRRLYSTLDAATTRYPEDPEVWAQLALARTYFPPRGGSPQLALAAFDRVLALDSSYLPGYDHTALLSFYLDRPDDARRYFAVRRIKDSAYAATESARLIERLVDPTLRSTERESLIAHASTHGLVDAQVALDRWLDSAETAVRLAHELLGRNRAGEREDRLTYVEALFLRGHATRAMAVAGGRLDSVNTVALMHLAMVGAVPAESLNAHLERYYSLRRLNVVAVGLPLWAMRRDTGAILRLRRALNSYAIVPAPHASPPEQMLQLLHNRKYYTARTAAYLALARGDSELAFQRFLPLSEPDCTGCSYTALRVDRLVLARLLASRGRDREALSQLEFPYTFGVPLSAFDADRALEIGRVAARLGERERAIAAYRYVLHMWPHPDSALTRYVAEAARGLARLH